MLEEGCVWVERGRLGGRSSYSPFQWAEHAMDGQCGMWTLGSAYLGEGRDRGMGKNGGRVESTKWAMESCKGMEEQAV